METMIIKMVFGHFIGDFFFQVRDMANNKYVSGRKGFLWCSFHVLVYTLSIAVSIGNFSPIFLLGVYLPHWLIDRYSLAYQWMRLIGRGYLMSSDNPKEVSFGTIIYVVIDQTIHFGCLLVLLNFV